MLIFFLQGGTVEQPSLSTNEQQKLPALAQLFSQYPITPHNQWINEEAGRLVLANPYPLFRLGELMKQACELVHSSEYNYKKGKNQFKLVDGSDAETPPTPKRPKMDTEMRQQRMQVLEEDIEALNNQMNYKRKRLQNAEINKRYDQCEVISKEIQEVKVQKRALESELAAFCRKEKNLDTNKRRKSVGMKPDVAIRLVPNFVPQAVVSTPLTTVTSLHLLHHSLACILMLLGQLPLKLSVMTTLVYRQQKSKLL